MPADDPDDDFDPNATAFEMVNRAVEFLNQTIDNPHVDAPSAESGSLASALEPDLTANANDVLLTEGRLAKIETQTRLLSEAVIAMNTTVTTLEPTVNAIKAELREASPTPKVNGGMP